jgi:redox-regulated HSP33 family molecular chaperone
MENVDGQQIKKTIEGYTQNAEQNESTIWQRVKKAKGE